MRRRKAPTHSPDGHRWQLPAANTSLHNHLAYWWSMIFSENRYPPRIKSGAGFFGIMLLSVEHDLFRKPVSTFRDHALRGDEV
jgi:hypothetical protein